MIFFTMVLDTGRGKSQHSLGINPLEGSDKITAYSSSYYLLLKLSNEKISGNDERLLAMCHHENLDVDDFCKAIKAYENRDTLSIYTSCIESLKKCDSQTQIICIAWLINIAYSDSVMTKEEWKFIYKIYKKDLNLNHETIMANQRKLPSVIKSKKEG